MLPRSLTLAAFAGALMLPVPGIARPVTLKYRIAQTTEQTVDATAAGGGEQKVRIGYVAFLTVVMDDSAGGKAVRATVDSISTDSTVDPAISGPILSARGATGAGYVDAAGKLNGFESADTGQAIQMGTLRGLVTALFPKVKATAKAGDTWTDTTETTDSVGPGPSSRRAITSYTATAGAAKALKVDYTSSYSIAGSAPNGVVYEGTGRNVASFQRSEDGFMMDGTFNDNANMSFTVPQSPEPIPMSTVSAVTIALLR
jgi:hypothetical protein